MGTHISKVKSVDLDAWQDHEIEMMVKWGNQRANWYWESKLPDDHIPNELKIDNFVRTKYESRKWVASSRVPDPSTIDIGQVGANAETPSRSETPNSIASITESANGNAATATSSAASSSLLDDEFGLFSSLTSIPIPAKRSTADKVPARPVLPSPANISRNVFKNSAPLASPLQSAQNTGGSMSSVGGGRPDLKKSILSLYASPASSSSLAPNTSSSQLLSQLFRPAAAPSMLGANGMTHSLLNLELGRTSSSSSSINTFLGAYTTLPAADTNEWSKVSNADLSSASSANPRKSPGMGTLSGLDDDLFKNVWS